jgi:ABC-type multidrug transport system ATPase subunit
MQHQPLAIETAGLSKQFGRYRAVDNLHLAIRQGTVFGFLGPNGAGKTTTIRMLLGLIRPTSGGGRILGHDILRERAAILPHVGAIVESPAFYLSLSGHDNMRLLARTAGRVDTRAITNVVETIGLSGRAGDRVKTYSLGMKQRLAIAAALLNSPQLIFLDEPTNGLDPAGTVEVRELICELGASGHTISLSSHLLHEVEQMCSEVAIINHGKLVTQGRVADLLKQEATLLVEAEPLSILQEVAARFGVLVQVQGSRSVTMALCSERVSALVTALAEVGAQVYQITPQHASLEHLFLELTDEAPGTKGARETHVATATERTHHDLSVAS